ncbi:response regulator transcription factor [Falsibacillus pallidus]|uniref:DNA-binding response OmpR family regulator n=1 Tax=Falsibacillus pallidus TaxID=493781 RepID=A0A370GQ74_9BACI|nr:response regulator transcription factor [Falsibacillus pallidus]RDI45862.1 DNA-binding response OmpR family regulator [Falsibacillus pallidus]
MKNILLVDDEVKMLNLLELYLTPNGFNCLKANSGSQAIEYLTEKQVDAVLLDIMMQGMDGWETCEEIRKFSDIPIIMVTARDNKADMIYGLNSGSDDYITKPFDEDILIARLNAVLRRTHSANEIIFNELIWNEAKHTVLVNGKDLTFTPIEFSLLGLFLGNQDIVLSRDQLINNIWGFDSEIEDRTVDSHIRNIREKLRKVGFQIDEHLATLYGIGYQWRSMR